MSIVKMFGLVVFKLGCLPSCYRVAKVLYVFGVQLFKLDAGFTNILPQSTPCILYLIVAFVERSLKFL